MHSQYLTTPGIADPNRGHLLHRSGLYQGGIQATVKVPSALMAENDGGLFKLMFSLPRTHRGNWMNLLRSQVDPAAELTQKAITSVVHVETKLAAPQLRRFVEVGIVLPGLRQFRSLKIYRALYII